MLVGRWYSSNEPLWWLSFCDEPEQKPWWKFWRRARSGEFLGVAIVQAEDAEAAVQEAWRRGINPGGEVAYVLILNADLHDMNRLLNAEEATALAHKTKVLNYDKIEHERDAQD